VPCSKPYLISCILKYLLMYIFPVLIWACFL
jgi:hypothetical protein